jgi:beta-lactam-binding protein with PASTA domain
LKRLIVVAGVVLLLTSTAVAAGAIRGGANPARQTARVIVPRVIGFRMDRATRTLHLRGLRVNEECSGVFGCIVKSRWWVCQQSPRAGGRVSRLSTVVIYAERRGEC